MKLFKTTSRKKNLVLIWSLSSLICFLNLSGCDGNAFESAEDDGNYEAKLQDAIDDLDHSRYEEAYYELVDLQASHDNSEVRQYLSSACAGMAGLDSYRVLEVADELSDASVNGIDLVGLVLGDIDGTLTTESIGTKLEHFSVCAIPELSSIENPSKDQIIQLGLFSLNHAALLIGQIIADDIDLDTVSLTGEGINGNYETDMFSYDADADIKLAQLADLGNDILRVKDAIDAIGGIMDEESSNDLDESFNAFVEKLDPDDSNTITEDEIEAFLNEL